MKRWKHEDDEASKGGPHLRENGILVNDIAQIDV